MCVKNIEYVFIYIYVARIVTNIKFWLNFSYSTIKYYVDKNWTFQRTEQYAIGYSVLVKVEFPIENVIQLLHSLKIKCNILKQLRRNKSFEGPEQEDPIKYIFINQSFKQLFVKRL